MRQSLQAATAPPPVPPPGGMAGGEAGWTSAAAGTEPPLGRKVLIVEDNYLAATEFEAALAEAGYAVVGLAASADEAVALARRERPKFVLMDVRLTGPRDGISAALEIYQGGGPRSIFVTANDDPNLREQASVANPIGWIAKPVSGPRLIARLADLAAARA